MDEKHRKMNDYIRERAGRKRIDPPKNPPKNRKINNAIRRLAGREVGDSDEN